MIADCDSGRKRQISRPHRLRTIFLILPFCFAAAAAAVCLVRGWPMMETSSWGRRRIWPRAKLSGRKFRDLSQLIKSSDAAARGERAAVVGWGEEVDDVDEAAR